GTIFATTDPKSVSHPRLQHYPHPRRLSGRWFNRQFRKLFLREKSTFEFNITTDTVKSAYCNGVLMSDVKSAGKRTRQWVLNKEISGYLASVAVADYTQVNWSTPAITGTVPIVLAARPSDTTTLKNNFVNLKMAFNGFENYYGAYVWNRVGYVVVPFSAGAMEHATNIAYPAAVLPYGLTYEADIMAHELSHHWWGDLMTCETQEDMWLNEGMATYSQRLFKEWKYTKQQYMSDVVTDHEFLLHCAHFKEKAYRAVSGIPHAYTYGDHVYKKGADVAHTLRTYMGDVAFFTGLKYVLAQKSYKNMNSAEFKTLLETSSGLNLSDFFNAWVFAGGWPHFSIDSAKYAFVGPGNYKATVSLKQKLTGAPALYNNVPIEVSFFNSNWSRTVKSFTMSGANQTFTTSLPFNPVYSAINYDTKISDAVASETIVIKTAATISYTLAKATLTVSSAGTDSSLIRVEHNYTAPDPVKFSTVNYKLSNQHYWKVDGILSPGFLSKIRFNFDGNPIPATVPSTPGAYVYMDTCLTGTNSDSLVILYRKNAADDWREVNKYTKFKYPGPGRYGFITVDTLKLGEYTFANKNGSSVITGIKQAEAPSSVFKVFPNPASSHITVQMENYSLSGTEVLEIRNSEGRQVHHQALKAKEAQIDCSAFAKGTYFVNIIKQGRIISAQKVVLQ
ncbi:MAG: M1 family aminopeptidase, partial [Bacteroidia bacterium]